MESSLFLDFNISVCALSALLKVFRFCMKYDDGFIKLPVKKFDHR